MDTIDVIDIYTVNGKTYMDLNPTEFIEFTDREIAAQFTPNCPPNLEIHRTTTYNVAIYIQFDQLSEVKFSGKVYKPKVVEPGPPLLSQLCLVFKNEWSRIQNFINFYKRVHGVERFLLYDNNSDEKPLTEVLERSDVIYIPWLIPYKHTIKDKQKLSPTYTGPDEIIVGQNSAYSNALKKYGDATWTILLDVDELVVRRSYGPSLKAILEGTDALTNTLIVRGFWAGCNNYSKNMIYENLRRISRRSNKICMQKLILRTSKHKFTDCIHHVYQNGGNASLLPMEKGIYFFHLYTLSEKRGGKCDCKTYCCQMDRSLMESCMY